MIKRSAILRLSQPAASAITAVAACRRRALVLTAFIVVLALAAWTSAGCTTDPYFADVADIRNDHVETMNELQSDLYRESDECVRSVSRSGLLSYLSTAACDRARDHRIDIGAGTRAARRATERLDPPPDAAIWHRDYLNFLDDYATLWDDVRPVLPRSEYDVDRFMEDFDLFVEDMESLYRRHDDLSERLRSIQ